MSIFCAILILILPALFEGLEICGDWTVYKDIKCIKVVRQKGTAEEAMGECSRLDSDATLVSIHSREEQEFLVNLLQNYSDVSIFAWLGLKYQKYQNQSGFKWIDGTKNNYSNWADDALRDGSEPCVTMSLARSNLGQWIDESCRRTALIVCQKNQKFTLNTLKEAVEAIEKKVEQGAIPIGFLYTQLPEQSPPKELWPHLNWTEVTQKYAGLFFRAEGNGTAPFGQIQQANQSTISTWAAHGLKNGYEYHKSLANYTEIKQGWNNFTEPSGFYSMGLHMTSGEVRPINTAVKIWKRVA